MKRCKPAKGKRPEPFWRESKQAWYIQLRDGRQRSLGRDEEGAWKEYHKLMLHEDGAAPMREYQVREIFEIYLEYCQKETASYDLYSYFLNDAAKSFGRLAVIDLKPFHVTRWVDRHPDWGTTTRSMVVTVVKAAFNYCVKQGHLEGNPIRLMLVPAPEARDRVLSPEECQEIFTSIKDRPFADYLLALSESGARPGEVAKLTPENVDLDLNQARFPESRTVFQLSSYRRIVSVLPYMKQIWLAELWAWACLFFLPA